MIWLGTSIIIASVIIYAGLQNAVDYYLENKNKKKQ